MVIQHNVLALKVHNNMMLQSKEVGKRLERLSSGSRINRAADDAAGLAISEKMRAQIRGLRQASLNTMGTISMLQTAEGALNEQHTILQRMRELAVQAANGTYSDEDRAKIAKEYDALKEEITRTAETTHYNGIKLLDGSSGEGKNNDLGKLNVTGVTVVSMGNGVVNLDFRMEDGEGYATLETGGKIYRVAVSDTAAAITFDLGDGKELTVDIKTGELQTGVIKNLEISGGVIYDGNATVADGKSAYTFQTGANGSADQRVTSYIDNMASYALGDPAKGKSVHDSGINTRESAQDAIGTIDKAINQVSDQRASIGAQINRLQHTINNIDTQMENLQAAESRIRDADMAEEMMEFVKHNILLQAAQAMLAQAMNKPESILQLLKQ